MQRAALFTAAGTATYLAGSYAVHCGYLPGVQPYKMVRGVAANVLHSPVYDVWEVTPDEFAPIGGAGATHVLYMETRMCGTVVSWKDRAGAFSLWISDGSRTMPKGEASFKCIGATRGDGEEWEKLEHVESAVWDRMMSTVREAGVTTLYGTSHTPQLSPRMAKMGFEVVEEDYDGASSNGVKLDMACYHATA